jgi:hypothetical protein
LSSQNFSFFNVVQTQYEYSGEQFKTQSRWIPRTFGVRAIGLSYLIERGSGEPRDADAVTVDLPGTVARGVLVVVFIHQFQKEWLN